MPAKGVNYIHQIVMIANPSRFYHVIRTAYQMTGFLYRGKDWTPSAGRGGRMTIERVAQPSFCDMGSCPEFASWRISYSAQTVELCAGHTLATMRNRRFWVRR